MVVPDFLDRCGRTIYERDGFCFTISLDREDDTAMFTIMFQNRFTGRSIARIALRPLGSKLAVFSPSIECGPAGFCVLKFPVAIPSRHQGRTAVFQLAANAEYWQGKGREVRFRKGRSVPGNFPRKSPPWIMDVLPRVLSERMLGLLSATIRLKLPNRVADYLPEETTGHAEELWSLAK